MNTRELFGDAHGNFAAGSSFVWFVYFVVNLDREAPVSIFLRRLARPDRQRVRTDGGDQRGQFIQTFREPGVAIPLVELSRQLAGELVQRGCSSAIG